MNVADYTVDDEELDRIFDKQVRRYVFNGYPRTAAEATPTLVLLGGQPGAGKSSAVASISQRHPGQLVPLTGDELRQFHPQFDVLRREHSLLMPRATGPAAGAWVERALDHALKERYSLLFEGVFRDPLAVVQTAERFKKEGYRVEVVGLAVPEAVSRLSTVTRYLYPGKEVARWTSTEGHDRAFRMVPAALQACDDSPHVDALFVTNRQAAKLHLNTRTPEGAWQNPTSGAATLAALAERTAPPAPDQARVWLQTYIDASRDLIKRGQANDTTLPTMQRLSNDAQRMAAIAYPRVPAVHKLLEQRQEAVAAAAAGQQVKVSPVKLPNLAKPSSPPTPAPPASETRARPASARRGREPGPQRR